MTRRASPHAIAALAFAAAMVAAPAAQADSLETPVERGANFASAGGWQAWSSRQADGTHRLQLRRPDGTVLTPSIPAFGAPVDPAIGTRGGADGTNTPASRRLSAVYSRCAGSSQLAGCDVHALDLSTLEEAPVAALASKMYSETAPSLTLGNWSFVRRGAPRPGVYSYLERGTTRGIVRLSPTLARETATSQGRAAFTYRTARGFGVSIRRSSGRGEAQIAVSRLRQAPVSPQITRYRAGWLMPEDDATRVFITPRFFRASGSPDLEAEEASRTLPAGVRSAAGDAVQVFTRYLDARGVQRIEPGIP